MLNTTHLRSSRENSNCTQMNKNLIKSKEKDMGAGIDQMKMINQLRKAQKDLKNEIVEVEAGEGAVIAQITGELKIKKITIDPKMVDLDDIAELERWLENALRDGYAKAQEIASDKMKPLMGNLGSLGL